MKHKNRGCPKCKGQGVVFIKDATEEHPERKGYYEVCDSCNPSKEDKEGDFTGSSNEDR